MFQNRYYFRTLKALLMGTFLIFTAACSSVSLELATPFKVVTEFEQKEDYTVVVTYTEFKNKRESKKQFNQLVDGIMESIETSEGLYGYSIRRDFLGNSAWTYTIWRNNTSMQLFKVAPAHLNAMKNASNVLNTAKFANVKIQQEQLPYSWDDALNLLENEGRSYNFTGKDY